MAFIVEDGTGVTGANSYASVAELEAYAEFRLDVSGYTAPQKQAALVVASSDWLDGQHCFSGDALVETQGMHFPVDSTGVPADIKTASLKAALLQLQGLLLVNLAGLNVSGTVESESKSVGPLSKSVTYAAGTSQKYSRILPKDLTDLLNPYLCAGGGLGSTVRI